MQSLVYFLSLDQLVCNKSSAHKSHCCYCGRYYNKRLALLILFDPAHLPAGVAVSILFIIVYMRQRLTDRLTARVKGLSVNVYRIENRFFGESVTVAGLLTGKDVSEQLQDKSLGDELLFPAVMLRADGDVFLDDMTPAELSEQLGVPVCATESDGRKLIDALLGIDREL